MQAVSNYETSRNFYQNIRRNISEKRHLDTQLLVQKVRLEISLNSITLCKKKSVNKLLGFCNNRLFHSCMSINGFCTSTCIRFSSMKPTHTLFSACFIAAPFSLTVPSPIKFFEASNYITELNVHAVTADLHFSS
jgi:hypothetical protein